MMYVTFQIKPCKIAQEYGYKTAYFAVECLTSEKAKEVVLDLNACDGINYIKINKCGKLRKGTRVIKHYENYLEYL